ncbi:MAG: sirohydrochlorin cobaltochelatase [Bacteroidales bacterium]|nr:sirohydrochlorin cobaltochelatase [Bacteroidales bacterium]
MRTKLLLVAAFAMLLGLSSCSKDDKPSSNYDAYQKAVNETVKSQKRNNKVILLVAFGSTWQQAYDAFDATVAAYKSAFPSYDVFLSFSSAICINRAAAGENVAPRNFYAPPFWLTAFAQDGVKYDEIVVQSLQVIPGEEYTRVINYIKDFANNSNGDLDDSYLSRVKLKLGVPLLQDADSDVNAVAKALDDLYKSKAASGVVAFMGHGNPDSYDTYKANIRYTQLEEALQTYSTNYFVGTVDMMANFKTNVLARMQAAGITSGTVYCHPLMSIAGDHAHNDMAGDDNENGAPNEEGEVEDTSWKCYFAANGYTCNDDTQIVKGLLELPTVRQIWMNHTTAAINGEPLDYYHSKDPE